MRFTVLSPTPHASRVQRGILVHKRWKRTEPTAEPDTEWITSHHETISATAQLVPANPLLAWGKHFDVVLTIPYAVSRVSPSGLQKHWILSDYADRRAISHTGALHNTHRLKIAINSRQMKMQTVSDRGEGPGSW